MPDLLLDTDADVQALANIGSARAEFELNEYSVFFPAAAWMDERGDIFWCSQMDDADDAPLEVILDHLSRELGRAQLTSSVRASAEFVLVSRTMPGGGRVDAISMTIRHRDRDFEPQDLFAPMTQEDDRIVLDPPREDPQVARVFDAAEEPAPVEPPEAPESSRQVLRTWASGWLLVSGAVAVLDPQSVDGGGVVVVAILAMLLSLISSGADQRPMRWHLLLTAVAAATLAAVWAFMSV